MSAQVTMMAPISGEHMNPEMSGPRILFVAGGTGGHLFPAIAVADKCRELAENVSVRFVGAKGKLEEEAVPRAGYEVDLLWISGFNRSLPLKNVALPAKIVHSFARARKIIGTYRPDIVVCAGAYVSYPLGKVAISKKIPLILMESNALPGMVIRKLAPKAAEVHVAFEETKKFLPGAKVIMSGNPVRKMFDDSPSREEACRHFGLDPDRPVLFAFGGSLGARSINNCLDTIVDSLLQDGLQVIWQTGKSYGGEEKREKGLYRSRFIHEMGMGYAAADLVLSRAGATTIAELKSVGKPAILVPLPTAADDHQRVNAEAMEAENAAAVLLDRDLASNLYGKIIELLGDREKLEQMGRNAHKLDAPEAAENIAEHILNCWRSSNGK